MPAPIRVAIVGLSPSGGWSPTTHLPALLSSPSYTITGILNSSPARSAAAITHFSLPATTIAFPSLAALLSSDADLVVCCVAVFDHAAILQPALAAGKAVFAEWALATSSADALAMVALARKHAVRSVVGLQARCAPLTRTLARLLATRTLGRILASNFTADALSGPVGDTVDQRWAYFLAGKDPRMATQALGTIYFGHIAEAFARLFGEPVSVAAQMATTWPVARITHDGATLQDNVPKTAADYVTMHGTTEHGVLYSAQLRGGSGFDEPGLVWDIIGTEATLRVTAASGMINLDDATQRVRVRRNSTGHVVDVPVDQPAEHVRGTQNIGVLYDLFAAGDNEADDMPTLEHAAQRHLFIDALFEAARTGQTVIPKRLADLL